MRKRVLALLVAGAILAATALPALASNGDNTATLGNNGTVTSANCNASNSWRNSGGVWVDCGV